MLTGFWYRALPSDQVGRGTLHKAMLLETPLVIGRDSEGQLSHSRTHAPIEACRSIAANSMANRSNVDTMAGVSMRSLVNVS